MKQSSYVAPQHWQRNGRLEVLVLAVVARSLSLEGLHEAIEYLQRIEAARSAGGELSTENEENQAA
jgi:hypothetical protein